MAEPEQLQELTHDLGNFTFQIYCTTHTPTHWKMKSPVLFTFINQDSLPKATDVHLTFLEHRVDSFPHPETTTVLHHRGFYVSKPPSEQFKQLGSLLPCS